jgi:hypothetical protein
MAGLRYRGSFDFTFSLCIITTVVLWLNTNGLSLSHVFNSVSETHRLSLYNNIHVSNLVVQTFITKHIFLMDKSHGSRDSSVGIATRLRAER